MGLKARREEEAMGVWPEVMRSVDGRLFDAESYERSELLDESFAGAPGYYVVVWAVDAAQPRQGARPRFMGPFPTLDLAFATANALRTSTVSQRSP
jgi:hypothetical protein